MHHPGSLLGIRGSDYTTHTLVIKSGRLDIAITILNFQRVKVKGISGQQISRQDDFRLALVVVFRENCPNNLIPLFIGSKYLKGRGDINGCRV